MNVIEIRNIFKAFGEKVVLDNISISIKEGEIFGMLGPSGAGKTTLIKILTGQLSPTKGNAMILGANTNHLTDDIYAQIGMVLDDSGLYTRLTCYDNLSLFAEIYGVDKRKITEALKKVGLEEAKKRPVNKLSKGMAQRLVLARAIMNSPKLLFLDEPTSGLDPATTLEIHRIMEELKAQGTTIFLTTHNMGEATKLCDRVALLNEGNIIENDSPEDICNKYNEERIITLLLKDGSKIEIPNDPLFAEKSKEYFQQEMVETIHSSEPTLETVFISLTGKKLDAFEN